MAKNKTENVRNFALVSAIKSYAISCKHKAKPNDLTLFSLAFSGVTSKGKHVLLVYRSLKAYAKLDLHYSSPLLLLRFLLPFHVCAIFI